MQWKINSERKYFIGGIPDFLMNIKNIIIESLRSDENRDYTKVNTNKAILLLSIPMMLEMIMESIFAVVDIFFVSKLGPEAVATVGLTESMMTIIYAIGFGIATAATAVVSRRVGEKNNELASVSAFNAILYGLIVSLLIAVPGYIFAEDLLRLMGGSETVVNEHSAYAALMLGGNLIVMQLFVINAIFRSAGDAAISMRVLWIANLLNIVLDPMFIFGFGPIPALGVKGAAIATNIGRGIAVIYQLYLLFGGKSRIKLSLSKLKPDFAILARLMRLSVGTIGQNLIATASWVGLMRIVSEFGSVAIAGYTIAIRILLFILLPSWGLANAGSTLVGQNLGAKQAKEAERSVWLAGKYNVYFLGIVAVLFYIFSADLIRLFIADPAVIEKGAYGLRIISIGLIMYGLGMVMVNAFNGAGDSFTPVKMYLICFWAIEIPLALLLSITFDLKESGVYFSILISETILTLIAIYLFRKGKWKGRVV